jgi:N6-adenosine-specific RNA methylase IME4
MTLRFHPLAGIFPLIEGVAFEELTADIAANGLKDPITLHQGMIVDGRNRYRACLSAGIELKYEILGVPIELTGRVIAAALEGHPLTQDDQDWLPRALAHLPATFPVEGVPGVDALAFVVSRNLHRRHLTDDQRRMVAARLVTAERGRPSENTAIGGISRRDAAALMAADVAGVERARTVVGRGLPEVAHAVDAGALSVRAAAEIATLPAQMQRDVLSAIAESAETGAAFRAVVKERRALQQLEKKERRIERERELGGRLMAWPTKIYGVIYADPEWRFEPYSRETGMDRAADNHYPTSPTNDIVLRPVGSIAAKDSVLFLWGTAPMIKAALRVMEGWGYEYVTQIIWHKIRPGEQRGSGYWVTGEHEILLIGKRGNIPAPAPGTQWPSVIAAPVGEHSEKPEIFAELIEAYFPTLPKIELNARIARPGWDRWGLEAPDEDETDASPQPLDIAVSDFSREFLQ